MYLPSGLIRTFSSAEGALLKTAVCWPVARSANAGRQIGAIAQQARPVRTEVQLRDTSSVARQGQQVLTVHRVDELDPALPVGPRQSCALGAEYEEGCTGR